VSKAIGLLAMGEQFFKGGQLEIPNCTLFLKPAYQSISWAKGVLRNYIEETTSRNDGI